MKMVLLFVAFCSSIISFSQSRGFTGSTYAGSDGVPHDLQFRDADGNLILIGDHPDVNGTPMLNDSSGYATILFRNGKKMADSLINYSLFDDKLFYKQKGKYYSFADPVMAFTISYPSQPAGKSGYYFKSGYPVYERNDNATFYEVLAESNTLQLLKWQHKKIVESQNYGSAPEREFVSVQEYIAFLPKENKLIGLGRKMSLKEVKKSLPAYAAQIDAYIAIHPINPKLEDQWMQLFEYLGKN